MTMTATISETSVASLIGGSVRSHEMARGFISADANNHRHSSRRQHKTLLHKLISMVEPKITSLRTDIPEFDKDENASIQSIEEILSSPTQRQSFQLFIQNLPTFDTGVVSAFQFLCLCREFRELGEKIQYGPYRIRVLGNCIYQNFIKNPEILKLNEITRNKIERCMASSRTNPTVFEEAFQHVSHALVSRNIVKNFLESGYHQPVYDEDDMFSHLKGLTLDNGHPLSLIPSIPHVNRQKHSGSLSSSNNSSIASSTSKFPCGLVFGGHNYSSGISSGTASEVQSVYSSRTGSSKSSTGSNASVAYDKYYLTKNTKMQSTKSRKKAPLGAVPSKFMEMILPKLNAVAAEQELRIKTYGLGEGPDGADTPQAKINSADMGPPPQKPLSLTNLLHSHDLPLDVNPNKGSFSNFAEAGVHHAGNSQQQKDNFSSKLDDRNLVQHGGFESHVMEDSNNNQPGSGERKKTISHESVEAMICDDDDDSTKNDGCSNTQVIPDTQFTGVTEPMDAISSSPQPSCYTSQIQIAYSFNDEQMLYGKMVLGKVITLRQFKGIVKWNGLSHNARFFFKRQLPGIGEVYDEISHDNSPLPFWHANTVFAKIESVSNTLPASQPSE